MHQLGLKKIISYGVLLLGVIALLALLFPIYRSFFGIMVNTNEGWNAFFAEAAMGKMPLYPSLDRLITNNYPPLSFYVVGSFGKLLGDTILAGRLLSLGAVLAIAFFIGKIIRHFGGSFQAALVGGAYFVATMSLYFRWYVGVNDPQLLAQAIMVLGFFLFLQAMEQDHSYWLPLLVMVIAGFFKHNIVTLPLSAMLGLVLWRRWKALFFCGSFSIVLILGGLLGCYFCYGIDFLNNFLTPRQWMFGKAIPALGDLRSLALGIFLWFFISWKRRQQKVVQLITIMIIMALGISFLQRLGSGVFVNAQFDLIIVIAIAMGFGFQLLANKKKELWQLGWLLLLMIPFCSPNLFSFCRIFSPKARAQMTQEEQLMNQLIQEVHSSPVNVFCESYITFRAGKPFVIDAFNVEERIKGNKLPPDTVDLLIREGKLREVQRKWQVGEE